MGVSHNSKHITHHSSLISQNSISLKTQNWKFLFSSNISKLCPISQYSTFSLFGGAHNLQRLEGQFSLVRVLFSLLSPKILFCLPISTHTMLEQRPWFFPFPFPSLHFCLHGSPHFITHKVDYFTKPIRHKFHYFTKPINV